MSTSPQPLDTSGFKEKPWYKKPDGILGTIVLLGLLGIAGYGLFLILPTLVVMAENVLYLTIMLLVLAAILYMVFDPRMRTLISYSYKSIMRKITGMFITIDPIGILKNYIEDLQKNLQNMSKQIGAVRGQMRKLKQLIDDNNEEIQQQMAIASKAKEEGMDKQMVLSSRKAARLQESNKKYQQLRTKLEVLHRVLSKMYTNSEILLEDTKDQVKVKEEERKAIRASHGAMKSAMNVIRGDSDKRIMFDRALEVIADDVANKVGEMERFMELSSGFMDSIDLQNGVFEEQGLQMLEQWEKESTMLLLGDGEGKDSFFSDLENNQGEKVEQKKKDGDSDYSSLFE
jgi:phage shock protein A